jgi:putative FmdB family regulatory protein
MVKPDHSRGNGEIEAMPTYEYRCPSCGDFEVVQRITETPLSSCGTCGKPVERLISATAFVLKGSGWYATDYARKAAASGESKSEDKKPSGDAVAASSETKSETSSGGGHCGAGACGHCAN